MSYITWTTPAGNLGTVPENEFFEKPLVAIDSDGNTIFYRFLSGQMPPGLQVAIEGSIQGIPAITQISGSDTNTTFTFAVRAFTDTGAVSDRTFSMTISSIVSPVIEQPSGILDEIFDGTYYEYQFTARDTSTANLTFSVIRGAIPPGMNFTTDGLLSGFPELIDRGENDVTGYDEIRYDSSDYDNLIRTVVKSFTFTIRVTDGLNFDVKDYVLTIRSKANWVADTDFSITNTTFVETSWDNKYTPIMVTPAGSIGTVRTQDKFGFQFEGYDGAGDTIAYTITNLEAVGFDQNGFNYANIELTDTTNLISGMIVIGTIFHTVTIREVTSASHIEIEPAINVSPGTNLYFNEFGNATVYTKTVVSTPEYVLEGQPFDAALGTGDLAVDLEGFDQGEQKLPTGLSLNYISGWLSGTAPTQTEGSLTYEFKVIPYKLERPEIFGVGRIYSLTVLGTLYNTINWITPSNLGLIDEGKPCTLTIEATTETGADIIYELAPNYLQQLPQGLRLTRDGLLIGRPTFRRFSVDGDSTILTFEDTSGIEVGWSVDGPGVGTGCTVSEIVDDNRIVVAPAIIVAAGSPITFFTDGEDPIVKVTIADAKTTTIDDEGVTTFDAVRTFTVKASATDDTASDIKTFSVRIGQYNLAPYENVYFKAFPELSQRNYFSSILANPSIFPADYIYRINDPWFGVAKDLKTLALPGIAPSNLSEYVLGSLTNHYNKNIRFGAIKTARAVDEFFNTKYEVVYLELIDDQVDEGRTILAETIDLLGTITNYYNNDSSNRYIYPNSFLNMRNKLGSVLGFENRGAFPDWMTSPQEDGRVLGFVNAVVICYTKPGYAKTIQYRLEKSPFRFNNIEFVADRYQVDNVLSLHYNTSTNRFLSSAETTFDFIPRGIGAITSVNYALTQTFYSINNRHVNYIRANGGIDGVLNFEDGQTLIFAQQESYAGNDEPYDGWIIDVDLWGTEDFDTELLGGYSIVPGYLHKIIGLSTQDRRAGIWRINIVNDIVQLEFIQELAFYNRIRVNSGLSFGGSVVMYSPLILEGNSVPRFVQFSRNNNSSVGQTTFDGNGTRFLSYRDKYRDPESGDKYIKFPRIGVFE